MGRLLEWLNEDVTFPGRKSKSAIPPETPTVDSAAPSSDSMFFKGGRLRKLRACTATIVAMATLGAIVDPKSRPAHRDGSHTAHTGTSVVEATACGEAAPAAQAIVQLHGWRCDTVNFCSPAGMFTRYIRIACNGNRYAYHVYDRGGRYVAELQ